MGLDVYLVGKTTEHTCWECDGTGIKKETDEHYSANITHNLTDMADVAGIYQHLWRPEELGITKAKDLIEPLSQALARMKAEPEKFRALNPDNGWGSYDRFVPWLSRYLEACEENPESTIRVSR